MSFKTPICLAILLAGACACDARAATTVDIQQLDARQLERNFTAAAGARPQGVTALQRHAGMLPMDPGMALVQEQHSKDRIGHYYRYQQTFHGLPIFGANLAISDDHAGHVRAMFGNLVRGVAADVPATTARISGTQALAIAKRATLGAREREFLVEDATAVKSIYMDDANRAHLALVVTFFAHVPGKGEPTEPTVIVDALDGRIISQWESLATAH
jgi:Zn-dependent metalloprotease